jgi:hypothetical protein
VKLAGVIRRELDRNRKLRPVGECEGSRSCHDRKGRAGRADITGDRAAGGDKVEGYPPGLAHRTEVERF